MCSFNYLEQTFIHYSCVPPQSSSHYTCMVWCIWSFKFDFSLTFSRCTRTLSVAAPVHFQSLHPYTFSRCTRTLSVAAPVHFQLLHPYTFSRCTRTLSVAAPVHFQSLHPYTFSRCTRTLSVITCVLSGRAGDCDTALGACSQDPPCGWVKTKPRHRRHRRTEGGRETQSTEHQGVRCVSGLMTTTRL